MTIQIRQDFASLIDETVQLRHSDREDEGSHDALTPNTVGAQPDAPSIDEEEILSEVAVRERLIEWLVGFLPFDSGGNQGSH